VLGLPLTAVTPTAQLIANNKEWLWFDPAKALAIWRGPDSPHGFSSDSPDEERAGGRSCQVIMRSSDFTKSWALEERTAFVPGTAIADVAAFILTILLTLLEVIILGSFAGCSSAKLMEFTPQITAQERIPSALGESIELFDWNKPVNHCADNAKGIAVAAEVCQLTPKGLKLKIPPDVRGWQSTQPGHVIAIVTRLGPSFRRAARKWGLENTTLVVTFNPSPDGEPPLGTLGMRLIPARLNLQQLPLEERRGNLLTTKISDFPAGGACVVSLQEFMKKSKGIWEFGDGTTAPLPNRLAFVFGPAVLTVGAPDITNPYIRGLMSANMIPGSAGDVQPTGENLPGAAILITGIKLVRTERKFNPPR